MENKMRKLFEYQRFENNARLAKLIEETESRYATALSDDDLDIVAAAGVPEDDYSAKDKDNRVK